MTNLKPSQCVIGVCLAFVAFLIPCAVQRPQFFLTNRGISDYGVNPATVLPFSVGMLLSIALLLYAGRTMLKVHRAQPPVAGYGLVSVAALQFALLLVPDNHIKMMRGIHIGFGVSLFVVEFVLSAWLIMHPGRKAVDYLVLFVLAVAGISSFVSLIHTAGALAQSEIVYQMAFLVLCIRGLMRIEAL